MKKITNHELEVRKKFLDKIEAVVNDLSTLCIRAKVPMFISLAYPNQDKKSEDDDDIYYDNRIISASLEMPGYARRINKLILAVNDCGTKLPEDINAAVNTLERWLENEGDYASDDIKIDKFRKFIDIANGQVEATIPHFDNDSEFEDVVTKKKE